MHIIFYNINRITALISDCILSGFLPKYFHQNISRFSDEQIFYSPTGYVSTLMNALLARKHSLTASVLFLFVSFELT